ncbi:hypothetical protein BsWGS_06398 [Bradybaena similaris]
MLHSLAFFLAVFVLSSSCTAQVTTNPPGLASVEENQADMLLFTGVHTWQDGCTIKAADGASSVPNIHIHVTYVAEQGLCAFNVTLSTPVDYEKTKSFTVFVYLRKDCTGVEAVQEIKKYVTVVNLLDTPPAFTNSVYVASVPENQVVDTAVVVNIRAVDEDGTDSVTYAVNFVDQQDRMFEARPQANPEILDIYLMASLDFELQHTYRFTIDAVDSVGLNSTCDVVVKVINIQDTPPYFTALQYNGRVREDAELGALVLSVSATDGDSVLLQGEWEGTVANQIYYSIIDGHDEMFAVNSSTGQITTKTQLDIDNNTNVTNGLVVLKIMAEEVNSSMEPQLGASSATVLVLVQIEDVNDNRPQFSSQSITGSIRADAALGEFITLDSGGYISVHDIDQAPSNNRFCLHIEQNGQQWDVFKPNIEMQYAYASVMIQLNKNGSLTDLAGTHIRFQIVAHECGHLLESFAPTKLDVTVWVKANPAPTATPDTTINLPLTTSDIIVFIVGLLLLLNVGLSVFICFTLRGRRGYPMKFLSRRSIT